MTKESQLIFYSFFTKYSLLDNYGFLSGLLTRLSLKILPQHIPGNSIEKVLLQLRKENKFKRAKTIG